MYSSKYLATLFQKLKEGLYTDTEGKSFSYDAFIEVISSILLPFLENDNKLMFIGNGGSAAIVSHSVVDFWKNGRMKTMCFNSPSLLTALSAEFGYEHAFEKAIDTYAQEGDMLFAISSSGSSKNILNAVSMAKEKNCSVVTLSGFSSENPLRVLGDYNCYIDSFEYGIVELAHQIILHNVLDYFMDRYLT